MTSGRSFKYFSSFFFSFFLFYAIAPVCCSLIGNGNSVDIEIMPADYVLRFSRELIFSRSAEESGEDDKSTCDVLLRKKRVTIPDNSLLMFDPSKECASLMDDSSTSSVCTSSLSRIPFSPPKSLKGFLSLHSGPPPPYRA
jgi:hypothetical protein